MSAILYSLAEARALQAEAAQTGSKNDFNTLFTQAQILRLAGEEFLPEHIAQMNWAHLRDWFQKQIADEVFRKKLFNRSVLISICYVSELLTGYAKSTTAEISITAHLSKYSANGNPAHILNAANAAFILFVFWPEMRLGRALKYRKFAREYGPALYAHYASEKRKDFGYYMAEAFEPLGDIARERLTLN